MKSHHEHTSKVTSWRGGELVDLPGAEVPDCVVWFAFGEDEDGPLWEGLSAQTGAPGEVTLRSVPYYVAGLALGDVVSTTVEDGVLVAVDHVTPSANLTIWVVFEAQGDDDAEDERWLGLMRDLEQWSCWYDVRSPLFVSVAAPALAIEPVAAYLRERQDAGELRFEIGQ